jgi:hypothetical protein
MQNPVARSAAALGCALLLAACGTTDRIRALVSPPRPPLPPTRIGVDLYAEPQQPLAAAAVDTPERAAQIALGDPPLIAHLRDIDGRYAGRRRARLTWTASVRRVPPLPEDPAAAADADASADEPPYWRVEIASSDVRDAAVYYLCDLRVGTDGSRSDAGRTPAQRCRWEPLSRR